MAGGGSFASDQQVAHATGDAQMVPTTQRARVTYIQAAGVAAGAVSLLSGGSTGTVLATVLVIRLAFISTGYVLIIFSF